MRATILLIALATSSFAAEDSSVVKIFSFPAAAIHDKGVRGFCATAFFISPTRLVMAAHTFEKGTTNHWIKIGPANIPVTIVRCDFAQDICVLDTVGYESPTWLTLQRNGTVRLKGFRKDERAQSDEIVAHDDRLLTSNNIIEGESGGPLVNDSGQVLGMGVAIRKKNSCIAISADTIEKFLDEIPVSKVVPAQDKH